MILHCVRNAAADLSDQSRSRLTREEHIYAVTVGQDYAVVALFADDEGVECLVLNDNGFPDSVPIGLFQRDMKPIPSDWFFIVGREAATVGVARGTSSIAVWGYKNLIEKDGYLNRLFEGDATEHGEFLDQIRHLSSLRA